MALINKLIAIADAIREKTGRTEPMTLDEMSESILTISGGSSEDLGVVLTEQEELIAELSDVLDKKSAVGVTTEIWTITLVDGTIVEKEVAVL